MRGRGAGLTRTCMETEVLKRAGAGVFNAADQLQSTTVTGAGGRCQPVSTRLTPSVLMGSFQRSLVSTFRTRGNR